MSAQSSLIASPGSFMATAQTTGATAATLRTLQAKTDSRSAGKLLPGVYDCIIRYLAQDAALPVVPGALGLSGFYHAMFTFDGSTYVAVGITNLDAKTDGTFASVLSLAAVAGGVNLIATVGTALVVVNHLAYISMLGPVY